jgi:hypothetical protein
MNALVLFSTNLEPRAGKARLSLASLRTYVAANDMLYWFFNVASTVLYREQHNISGDIVKIRFDEKL